MSAQLWFTPTHDCDLRPIRANDDETQTPLKTPVEGKTYDANKKHEAAGKYGKEIFAKRVVIPQAATIDFSGFASLLDRIVAVLDHHLALPTAKPSPPPAAAAS